MCDGSEPTSGSWALHRIDEFRWKWPGPGPMEPFRTACNITQRLLEASHQMHPSKQAGRDVFDSLFLTIAGTLLQGNHHVQQGILGIAKVFFRKGFNLTLPSNVPCTSCESIAPFGMYHSPAMGEYGLCKDWEEWLWQYGAGLGPTLAMKLIQRLCPNALDPAPVLADAFEVLYASQGPPVILGTQRLARVLALSGRRVRAVASNQVVACYIRILLKRGVGVVQAFESVRPLRTNSMDPRWHSPADPLEIAETLLSRELEPEATRVTGLFYRCDRSERPDMYDTPAYQDYLEQTQVPPSEPPVTQTQVLQAPPTVIHKQVPQTAQASKPVIEDFQRLVIHVLTKRILETDPHGSQYSTGVWREAVPLRAKYGLPKIQLPASTCLRLLDSVRAEKKGKPSGAQTRSR
jgi:hypothetical protein